MKDYNDYCTKLFGEHTCIEKECPTCSIAKIISAHDSELLDKVIEKIEEYSEFHYVDSDGYAEEQELIFRVDRLDDIINEIKAEMV